MWRQREVKISPKKRGCHLITKEILNEIAGDLAIFKIGILIFFYSIHQLRFVLMRTGTRLCAMTWKTV